MAVVVIGGGIAGVSCVETLAREAPDERIVIVVNCSMVKVVANVNKFGINLESFDVKEEQKEFLERFPNVEVIVDFATLIDTQKHEVHLKNSYPLKYKKLCICTGSRPKLIDHKSDRIIGIRDTETIEHFATLLKDAKRVVIVGNGGIALELIHCIENCQIIWVMKDNSIGTTFFDTDASHFLLSSVDVKPQKPTVIRRSKYVALNISSKESFGSALGPDWKQDIPLQGKCRQSTKTLQFGCEISAIYFLNEIPIEKKRLLPDSEDWPVFVELTNGKLFGCDFVVSATGVIPNVLPLQDSKCFKTDIDGGIKVDREMLTSEADVYAAGDVCTPSWAPLGNWFQMRLWTQAKQMGIYAAFCMLAHMRNTTTEIYFPFDVFAHMTRFFDYKVVLLGFFNGQHLDNYELLLRITEGQEYVKVVVKNNKVRGALLIGDTDLEETFENLILNQLDIGALKDNLLDPNIDIEDYFD